MPYYSFDVQGKQNTKPIPYSLYSRQELTDAEVAAYGNQYLAAGEKEYPRDSRGDEIKILPPSLQDKKSTKLGQKYEDNIAGPTAKGVRSVTDRAKQSSTVPEAIGKSGLPVGLQAVDESALGLPEGSQRQAGLGSIQAVENLALAPTENPIDTLSIAAGMATSAATGGTSLSPVIKLANTRLQRFAQAFIPPVVQGAVEGTAQYASDPRTTSYNAVDRGMLTAGTGLALNLAGVGLDRFFGSLAQRTDTATMERIHNTVNKRIDKDIPFQNPRQYVNAVTTELDTIAEKGFEESIDSLSKIVTQVTSKRLGETFRQNVGDLKNAYVALSKTTPGDEAFSANATKVYELLTNTKKIALSAKDDLLPYIIAQDRDAIADMLRLGYVDKDGAEALLRNLTNIGGEAYRKGQKLAKPSKNLADALPLPQVQALRDYIAQAPGKMAQIRQLQQIQALDEWYQQMQGVVQSVDELAQYKNALSRIKQAGPDTIAIRQRMQTLTRNEQGADLEQLLTAVYDSEKRNITSGQLSQNYEVALFKTKRTLPLAKHNLYPSSGINATRPGSSGAINAVTVRTLNSINSDSGEGR